MLVYISVKFAPVAQLDRVTGYEPVGRGFESLLAHQCNASSIMISSQVDLWAYCNTNMFILKIQKNVGDNNKLLNPNIYNKNSRTLSQMD